MMQLVGEINGNLYWHSGSYCALIVGILVKGQDAARSDSGVCSSCLITDILLGRPSLLLQQCKQRHASYLFPVNLFVFSHTKTPNCNGLL